MRNPCIAFFSMPDAGHFRRLLPMISGLAASGVAVHVFTHAQFRAEIEAAGASFFDLFSRYPLELADDESLPRSCRYVSYAARYADAVCDDVRRIRPAVIVYGTFTVIGHVVARELGIPHVNVCAGHNVNPAEFLRTLASDPRVKLAPVCWEAAERLRQRYGLHDASPFSFVSTLSPFLNVSCEPPEFLKPEERQAFEPLAFFGSLVRDDGGTPAVVSGKLRVYVSFGTVIWRHYADRALQALQAISQVLSEAEDITALISLGKHDLPRETADALRRHNVRVESYVDQQEILRRTDIFITHHGVNSTHEAILHRVPMISLPFFWDQPALASRCQELGLAVPLIDAVGEPVRPERVMESVLEVASQRDSMLENLHTAHGWERRVMAGRPAVLERIKRLEATERSRKSRRRNWSLGDGQTGP